MSDENIKEWQKVPVKKPPTKKELTEKARQHILEKAGIEEKPEENK